MYMTYPAMMIGDEAMYHALKKLKEKGGICGVHCENSGVIDALIAEKKAAGQMGVGSHPGPGPISWRPRPCPGSCASPRRWISRWSSST